MDVWGTGRLGIPLRPGTRHCGTCAEAPLSGEDVEFPETEGFSPVGRLEELRLTGSKDLPGAFAPAGMALRETTLGLGSCTLALDLLSSVELSRLLCNCLSEKRRGSGPSAENVRRDLAATKV